MNYHTKNDLEIVLPDKTRKTDNSDLECLIINSQRTRRFFSAEYKAGIIKQAAITRAKHGSIAAFLRAERLYSSQLKAWEKEKTQHSIDGLKPKRRGPKKILPNPLKKELTMARQTIARIQFKITACEMLNALQKKSLPILDPPVPLKS